MKEKFPLASEKPKEGQEEYKNILKELEKEPQFKVLTEKKDYKEISEKNPLLLTIATFISLPEKEIKEKIALLREEREKTKDEKEIKIINFYIRTARSALLIEKGESAAPTKMDPIKRMKSDLYILNENLKYLSENNVNKFKAKSNTIKGMLKDYFKKVKKELTHYQITDETMKRYIREEYL
jgi:uncharacterized small protein (DUF1192 family)